MDHAAFGPIPQMDPEEQHEQRRARRYSLLIRPAKLLCSQGEFVCVLRDVSSAGASAKLFHRLPAGDCFTLELQSGQSYEIKRVWERDLEAGFVFGTNVDVNQVVSEIGAFRKRGLRLALNFPVTLMAGPVRKLALVENISQQGARLECSELLALDQSLRLEGPGLRETRAKVRWRSDENYGLVFDDTFSLRDFALLAARLQAPGLLVGA